MDAPRPKPTPSPAAIAALREAASALDVEDLVDLCYATEPDELRVAIYLEGLRGRHGERAQAAACILCFDLAKRGDLRREAEMQVLLPTLDDLISADATGEVTVVSVLVEKSPMVASLWRELADYAMQRDLRAGADLAVSLDDAFIDIDLFDADDFAELAIDLEDIELSLDLDDEVQRAFDEGLNTLIPMPPNVLFSAETSADLERLEKLRELCSSFAGKHSIAAELEAMTHLFIGTHTRALGLFSRRNRRRDKALVEGVTALLSLPAPPEEALGWFTANDLPGSDETAWPKIAEVLLELACFVGNDVERHPQRHDPALSTSAWARGVAEAFVADPSSARVQPRLTDTDDRRRRRR